MTFSLDKRRKKNPSDIENAPDLPSEIDENLRVILADEPSSTNMTQLARSIRLGCQKKSTIAGLTFLNLNKKPRFTKSSWIVKVQKELTSSSSLTLTSNSYKPLEQHPTDRPQTPKTYLTCPASIKHQLQITPLNTADLNFSTFRSDSKYQISNRAYLTKPHRPARIMVQKPDSPHHCQQPLQFDAFETDSHSQVLLNG